MISHWIKMKKSKRKVQGLWLEMMFLEPFITLITKLLRQTGTLIESR